ncbi:MAG: hypothetical protein SF182_14600 [Deltaproteobacteria bacterium]|nr:hypothetical protein [Deltaproteobacteria bacterium]
MLALPAAALPYPRGDATCNANVTAADLVATLRGLGGAAGCGNDDCDRDGAVTSADVVCATGCLFGLCPVPPHAPQVVSVAADSAPAVSPASVVRIAAQNLGASEAVARVTVGGLEAEVIELGDGEIVVALPATLPPGPAEVVVFNDDVASAPFTLEVAPAAPVGAPDTFDGMLALVDALVARLLDLELESVYADATPMVRQEMQRYRATLATQRSDFAGDLSVSAAERLALDAAVDASGAPEQLRATIAAIDADLGAGAGSIAQTLAVRAVQNGARTIKVVRNVAAAAGTVLSGPAIAAIATAAAVFGGAVLAASDPATPLIFDVAYQNAAGLPRNYPVGGGFVFITGARFDSLTTSLELQAKGSFDAGTATVNGDTIIFKVPDGVGFCGKVTLQLVRTGGFRSNPVTTRVQPELLQIEPTGKAGETLEGSVRGLNGCAGITTFESSSYTKSTRVEADGDRIAYIKVPNVLPDPYRASVTVEGLRSERIEDKFVDVTNPFTGITLVCATPIDIPDTPSAPFSAALTFVPLCRATLLPEGSDKLDGTSFVWSSSSRNRATIKEETAEPESPLTARSIGSTQISVNLQGPKGALASGGPVTVEVTDNAKPRVAISSSTMSPVQSGGTIAVRLTATDNYRLGDVTLKATGDAVASGGEQTVIDCVGKKTCSADLTVTLKQSDFTQNTVTIQATAIDAGLKSASSEVLSFTVATDDQCPIVTFEQPVGNVNAGSQVLVVAHGSDNQPNDKGVTEFIYEATGPALVAPVSGRLPLPGPQPTSTLRFPISVKPSDELRDVDDLTIRISVTALDGGMHQTPCGAVTTTVNVLGVLDTCNGGIQVDKPAGYIGEAFTITVALVDAETVTRVTSINPGGQFDLQPRGGGVYTVTLFYQGTGSFSLRFVAFDADSNELCSGSIGLESLGPKPEAGIAAVQFDNLPAGASRP